MWRLEIAIGGKSGTCGVANAPQSLKEQLPSRKDLLRLLKTLPNSRVERREILVQALKIEG